MIKNYLQSTQLIVVLWSVRMWWKLKRSDRKAFHMCCVHLRVRYANEIPDAGTEVGVKARRETRQVKADGEWR